jgi:hypothetical protein
LETTRPSHQGRITQAGITQAGITQAGITKAKSPRQSHGHVMWTHQPGS